MGLNDFIKRQSIRANIMGSFVILSILFIGGIGGMSFLLFRQAGNQTIDDSIDALESQITNNIETTAKQNADLIDEKLSNAAAMVEYQATELEYLFSDENRYGDRDVFYDYVFEYDLGNAPADTAYDAKYGINVSYNYSSYYFEGSTSATAEPANDLQNVTLETVASMDYAFQRIHDNAPEFRWLYIAFELAGTDLFINYPGSIFMGDDAERAMYPYEPHLEDWYISVHDGGGSITFTEPYFDEFDEVPLITIGRIAYFEQNGTELAVICGDISIDDMVNKITNVQVLDTGYASLIMKNGLVVAHPEYAPTAINPDFADILDIEINNDTSVALTQADLDIITSGQSGILRYTRDSEERFLAYQPVGDSDYISIIILPVDEALAGIEPVENRMTQAIRSNLNTIWIIVGVSFAIGITVGLILTAYLTRPFTHLVQVARSLSTRRARKDIMDGLMTQIDPDLLKSEDEFGELTRAFKDMIDSVQEAEREKND
ncbi:MAG: HAMP domain-containing protein [Asgard group archaeon]|nr:HAMP domain-containing protein [Asgard group archaeon]